MTKWDFQEFIEKLNSYEDADKVVWQLIKEDKISFKQFKVLTILLAYKKLSQEL